MGKVARWAVVGTFLALGLGCSGSTAQAQGWDYGRQMFGFAQYYPGSGWSSYYHPNFDPQAFFPTTFGLRSTHQGTTFYAGEHRSFLPKSRSAGPGVIPPSPEPTPGRRWFFNRRRDRHPLFGGHQGR